MDKDLESKKNTEANRIAPACKELTIPEKNSIINKLFEVLICNNLSVKQCRELLTETLNEIDEIRPWNHISNLKSQEC